MSAVVNMAGQRFGILTVLHRHGSNHQAQATWLCRCECGAETTVSGADLRKGDYSSCGCKSNKVIHGCARKSGRSSEYGAWGDMIQRCYNPKASNYPDYGGRGIAVCDRWRHDAAAFLADMGPRPPRHSLDRIDVNGHYEPGNCRWTEQDIQNHNKRPASNTGVLGVTRDKASGRYQWSAKRYGKRLVGYSKTLSEAIAARAFAVEQLYPTSTHP